MPPKKSKTSSILQIWAKQQELEAARKTAASNHTDGQRDVITLSDSPSFDDIAIPGPSTVRDSGVPVPTAAPVWAALVRRTSSAADSPTPTAKKPVVVVTNQHRVDISSQSDLLQWGFDSVAASSILYWVNDLIRPYEMDMLSACLSANTCLSLPMAVSSDHVIALTIANFLRWFPRSRSIYCCGSLEAAELMRQRLAACGIPPDDVSIIHAFHTFKKLEDHQLGSVIITTPQCLTKMVESARPFLDDIRCVSLSMEPSEAATKYKKIVGPLLAKGVPFRVLISYPSIPDSSKRTSSITRRQQIITSLLLSNWNEISAYSANFRRFVVPVGLSVSIWKEIDVSSSNREWLDKWKEGTSAHLLLLSNTSLPLPSTDPDDFIYVDWSLIIQSASSLGPSVLESACNCLFLCESYRHLLIQGPRAFHLYCADVLSDRSASSRAEEIQLLILNNRQLAKTFGQIQSQFDYNSDSPFNITADARSLRSHVKYQQLKEYLERQKKLTSGVSLSGIICCESTAVARTVCESITGVSYDVTMVVDSALVIPPAHSSRFRPANRLTGIFYESRSTGLVLVLPMDLPAVNNILDTACSNGLHFVVFVDRRSICLLESHSGDVTAILSEKYEKLRESDGRLIGAADELAAAASRRSSMGGTRTGAVDRYDFKFEPSRVRLDLQSIPIKQIVSEGERGRGQMEEGGGATANQEAGAQEDATNNKQRRTGLTRRQGFEMTSSEFREYTARIGSAPSLPPVGTFHRKTLMVTNDDSIVGSALFSLSSDQLSWLARFQPTGGVLGRSPALCRMDALLETEPIVLDKKKRKYHYQSDGSGSREKELDDVIRMLDSVLASTG